MYKIDSKTEQFLGEETMTISKDFKKIFRIEFNDCINYLAMLHYILICLKTNLNKNINNSKNFLIIR